jgi:crotonobetainyl-CoA:carnitine CoA-transferase CaiB-like acyl-CoA transferase
MAGALDGIKVLEFSEIIAAPFAGMHLADMGADVLKIEPPSGDPWRSMGQFAPGENRYFIALNRGKRGMTVDLKAPEGREIAHRLVPEADVVMVNYRPDTPRALGIDYDTLRAINPRLVYVQNTAFGSRGPSANRPGYDIVAQAMSGLMASDGKLDDSGLPVAMNPPLADFSTGYALVAAVCAALYARERTGAGQKVELSLLGSAIAILGYQFLQMQASEGPAGMLGQLVAQARAEGKSWSEIVELQSRMTGAAGNAYYRCYHTSDGVIAVACFAPSLHPKFCKAVAVDDPRLAAGGVDFTKPEGASAVLEFVGVCEAVMRGRTTAEWVEVFDRVGVPAGPFKLVSELHEDEQVLANGMRVELDHPAAGRIAMAGPVFNMTETPSAARKASPTLGQDNDEVLGELGYTKDAIAGLRERGVIG